jgi:hypothetical protein
MDFLLELAATILDAIGEALFPAAKTKLSEWRNSDSLSLRISAVLIIAAIVLLIGFIIFWAAYLFGKRRI